MDNPFTISAKQKGVVRKVSRLHFHTQERGKAPPWYLNHPVYTYLLSYTYISVHCLLSFLFKNSIKPPQKTKIHLLKSLTNQIKIIKSWDSYIWGHWVIIFVPISKTWGATPICWSRLSPAPPRASRLCQFGHIWAASRVRLRWDWTGAPFDEIWGGLTQICVAPTQYGSKEKWRSRFKGSHRV